MHTIKHTAAAIVLGGALMLGSAFSAAMTGSIETIPPAPVTGADSALKAPPFVVAPEWDALALKAPPFVRTSEADALALKAPPFIVAPESGALAL